MRGKRKSAEVPVGSDNVTSTAAEMRKSFTIYQRAVRAAFHSVISCHALVSLFITCSPTKLCHDSAFIDTLYGHRRGLLVVILQESVKNSNTVAKLGRKALRDFTESC